VYSSRRVDAADDLEVLPLEHLRHLGVAAVQIEFRKQTLENQDLSHSRFQGLKNQAGWVTKPGAFLLSSYGSKWIKPVQAPHGERGDVGEGEHCEHQLGLRLDVALQVRDLLEKTWRVDEKKNE
jgi:hypothetical protein